MQLEEGRTPSTEATTPPGDGYYPPSLLDTSHFLHSDLGRLSIGLWAAPLGFLIAALQEDGLSTPARWGVTGAVAALIAFAVIYLARCMLRATPLRGDTPAGMKPYWSPEARRARYSKGRHRAQ